MDTKTRAEKIGNKLSVSRCTGEPEFFELVAWITSQLDEAIAAAVREAVKVDPLNHHYLEGFAAAIEQAAGIADHKECTDGCKDIGLGPMCTSVIAEQIRSLRPKEGEIQ